MVESSQGNTNCTPALTAELIKPTNEMAIPLILRGNSSEKSTHISDHEHFSLAVRFYNSARGILEEFDGVGPGSAACARVSSQYL